MLTIRIIMKYKVVFEVKNVKLLFMRIKGQENTE